MSSIESLASFRGPSTGLWLSAAELRALLVLPAWQFGLFCHLVLHSDASSGKGSASSEELVDALGPPPAGATSARAAHHSRRAIHRAMRTFEALAILRCDASESRKRRALVYSVAARANSSAA